MWRRRPRPGRVSEHEAPDLSQDPRCPGPGGPLSWATTWWTAAGPSALPVGGSGSQVLPPLACGRLRAPATLLAGDMPTPPGLGLPRAAHMAFPWPCRRALGRGAGTSQGTAPSGTVPRRRHCRPSLALRRGAHGTADLQRARPARLQPIFRPQGRTTAQEAPPLTPTPRHLSAACPALHPNGSLTGGPLCPLPWPLCPQPCPEGQLSPSPAPPGPPPSSWGREGWPGAWVTGTGRRQAGPTALQKRPSGLAGAFIPGSQSEFLRLVQGQGWAMVEQR